MVRGRVGQTCASPVRMAGKVDTSVAAPATRWRTNSRRTCIVSLRYRLLPSIPKCVCGVPFVPILSRLNSYLIARRAKIMVSVGGWLACSYCSSSRPSWDHAPALGTTYRIGPAAYRKKRPLGRAPPNTMPIDRDRMQKLLATRAKILRKQNPTPHCRNRATVPGAPKGGARVGPLRSHSSLHFPAKPACTPRPRHSFAAMK